MPQSRLDAALDCAARGFRVFPILPGGTTPAWKDFPNRATSDANEIRRVWAVVDYNIGVSTDDLIVVDADVKNGGTGLHDVDELKLPRDTFTVETPSGGIHLYYKGPRVACSVKKVAPGIDIRGFHGYVVGPGSETEKGGYRLASAISCRNAPDSLIASAGAPRESISLSPLSDPDLPDAVLAALEILQKADGAVQGAGGDQYTYTLAARIKDEGISEATALRLMLQYWNNKCSPPWEYEALKRKVENVFNYGTSAPGINSVHSDFADISHDSFREPVSDRPRAGNWIGHGEAWETDFAWLYLDVLPDSGACLLGAPSQAGKTFVALELAYSLATGNPFFGVEPEERGATLILCSEGESSLRRRMAAFGDTPALPIAARGVGALGAKGALDALLIDLKAKAAEMEILYDVPVRLIMLDTLPASGLYDDQNDNVKATTALQVLQRISKEMNAVVLATVHPPKSGNGISGAEAFKNSADAVIEIHRDGRSKTRQIELTKSREAEQRMLGSFTLEPVKLGQDKRGRDVVTCRVKQAPPMDGPIGLPEFMLQVNELLKNEHMSADRLKSITNAHLWKSCFGYAMSKGMLREEDGMVFSVAGVNDLTIPNIDGGPSEQSQDDTPTATG